MNILSLVYALTCHRQHRSQVTTPQMGSMAISIYEHMSMFTYICIDISINLAYHKTSNLP